MDSKPGEARGVLAAAGEVVAAGGEVAAAGEVVAAGGLGSHPGDKSAENPPRGKGGKYTPKFLKKEEVSPRESESRTV